MSTLDQEADGSTSLVEVGSNYFLYPVGGSAGPELSFAGAPIVAGQFGSWAPIGAEQTASGYEVAWKVTGADQYTVWATDSSGNYISNIIGTVSGTSAALESLEPVFQQDLNGDGVIGLAVMSGGSVEVSSAYSGPATFMGSSGILQLDQSASFSGTVAGMTGQDTLDLRDMSFATIQSPTYSGTSTGGTLSVSDGTHNAEIALLGNYLASTFVASSDGNGGTNVVDPSATAPASTTAAVGDEFVGPFPSWTNIKTAYGAKGDGITDDTAALQAALTNAGLNGHSSVVYLPAGTYKITSTLNLAAREHISIIGEDPATTIIKWAGASGGTELHIDGLDYSRFDRLTFDGAGVAGVLVDQSWSGGNYFDTGNQYADDVFENAAMGIQGGAEAGGFAETSVLRDHFSNLTTAGILTRNYNALDLWVSYSTFDHCYVGVGDAVFFPDGTTNINGAGAFEVSNSVFRYSGQDDISIGNVASPYAVRNNYSIGSKQFIITAGSDNSAPLSISGNTILDTTNPRSLSLGNLGPNVLYDNIIRSLPNVTSGPVVEGLNVVALGNTFTVPSAIQNQDWAGSLDPVVGPSRRITEIDTTVVSPSTISTTEPTLPGVEPNLHRQIFEVPVGADAATIQSVINSAAAQNGNRPIVHIPEGNYSITSTITIPADTDIQLVGDGNTKLTWTGTGSGPLLYLPGPTKATLRDLQLDGGYRPYDPHFAAGIVVDNIDQPGSIVYLDQVLTAGALQTNFLVNGLDYTDIEAHAFSSLYQEGFPGSVGVKIVGGPLAAAGDPQTGSVNIYSGLSAHEMVPWDVSGGGKLLVRDGWYEGSPSPAYLHVTGSGTVTIEGSMVALPIDQSTPTFDINNFKGNATFINDYTPGNWAVSGDGTQARVLGVGLNEITPTTTYFSNDASPAATVGLLQSMNATALGAYPTPNTGTLDDTFVKEMFAQTRGQEPGMLTALPAGVTDLRLFRVDVSDSGTNNLVFSAAPAPIATTVIESFGSTSPVEVGTNYFLYPVGGSSGPELSYSGAPVVAGQFGSWAPLGAEQTASGYEVAWKVTGADQYTVWATDSSGNYISSIIGTVSGTSAALESLEPSFHQDLNGDGVIGPPTTVIESFGSTSLVEVGTNYFLYPVGGSSGPELSYSGAPVVAGQFGSWTPLGAEQTASGYEVAWKVTGADEYCVWNTDSSGNYISKIIGTVSGTGAALESREPSFHQDLNGDGVIGPPATVIEADGSTSLVEVGSNYFLYPVGGSSGPELSYSGAPVVAGQFGSWAPIGAEQTASGYEIAWKVTGADQYTVWATDSSGNYISNITGPVSGTSAALESLEPVFQQDLNGDGVIGLAVMSGGIVEVSSAYSGPATFMGSSGILQLDQSASFSGTVAGMTGQDTLDLRDIRFATNQSPTYSGTSTGGTLSVGHGTHNAEIALLGNYIASTFVASSDGNGGTNVVDPATETSQTSFLVQPPHA